MATTPKLAELRLLSPIEWVKEERRRQERTWGEVNHSSDRFNGILVEEVGEVSKVLNEGAMGKLSQEEFERELEYELIQVAAVSIKWIEAIRRQKRTQLRSTESG